MMPVRTLEQQAQTLADYLPGGRLFHAKNIYDSNFRNLLRGFAGEVVRADGYLQTFKDDVIPDATLFFVDEWEAAVGIPDSCFSGTGTIEERWRNVLIKLASLGVQTTEDFVALGEIFGIDVTVRPAHPFTVFPLEFPVPLFDTEKEARFTIIVDFVVDEASRFPLTFPFIFGNEVIGVLECLFRRLKPANCDIIFRQV